MYAEFGVLVWQGADPFRPGTVAATVAPNRTGGLTSLTTNWFPGGSGAAFVLPACLMPSIKSGCNFTIYSAETSWLLVVLVVLFFTGLFPWHESDGPAARFSGASYTLQASTGRVAAGGSALLRQQGRARVPALGPTAGSRGEARAKLTRGPCS